MALSKMALPEEGATAYEAVLTKADPVELVRTMGRPFAVAIDSGPVTVSARLVQEGEWFPVPTIYHKLKGLYFVHDPVFQIRLAGLGRVTIFVTGR